jgi:molybdopterin synthase catalytic subunit
MTAAAPEAGRAWITRAPIEPATVLAMVGAAEDGAVVLFLGAVRDHNAGRPVSGMRYEAYEAMAASVLGTIAVEAMERLGTDRLAVVHRIGDMEVGDVSVAVAASSPHRAEAFDAARYVIEEIKRRLPVWKEEHYVEGEPRWLEGTPPPHGSGP